MEQTQSWYTSTTLQGALIAIIGFVASMLKATLKIDVISNDEINSLVAGLFGVIGMVMVIWGRIKATKKLGK